jgi:transposase
MIMARNGRIVIAGIDTHKDNHCAAVIDEAGARLGYAYFEATGKGYDMCLKWIAGFGCVSRVGIEGTGSYGAGLARAARAAGIEVWEVTYADKASRYKHGKCDPEDAYGAASAAWGRQRCVPAKVHGKLNGSLGALRSAYRSAVKSRTAAINTLHAEVVKADESLRCKLRGLTSAQLIAKVSSWRIPKGKALDCLDITRMAMHELACTYKDHDARAKRLLAALDELTLRFAPTLRSLVGCGPVSAADLMLRAGDDISSMRSEAAFCMSCGVSPIPASSGKSSHMRLSRGGDRQANKAIHIIALNRMRTGGKTTAFIERKMSEGKSKKDAIRALKRYVAREVFGALRHDMASLQAKAAA